MEAEPFRTLFPLPRLLRFALAAATALSLSFFFAPGISRADIYQWEDDQGTLHFTDDVSRIPPPYRKKATQLIREGPSVISPMRTSPPPDRQESAPSAAGLPSKEVATQAPEREKEELVAQVEQQKAKISAKEEHIRAVDEKRSLAVNPLRNRVVDQADLDLYDKYLAELPSDKEKLKEMESLLESIK